MVTPAPNVLVLACGNPARLDDGLGPALAEALEQARLSNVDVDASYQWTVEDAYDISNYAVAVLVDASMHGPEPFFIRKVVPSPHLTFTSHSVTPEILLGLATTHFQAQTTLYVLGIRGYVFDDFGERLSSKAQQNLDQAVEFVLEALASPKLELLARKSTELAASSGLSHRTECRSAAACHPPGLEIKPM